MTMPRGVYKRTGVKRGPYVKRAKQRLQRFKGAVSRRGERVLTAIQDDNALLKKLAGNEAEDAPAKLSADELALRKPQSAFEDVTMRREAAELAWRLYQAFPWGETTYGWEYWERVCQRLQVLAGLR